MRRIQIKIWPEIYHQYSAIIPIERIERNKRNPIDIDFTNTHAISSSGLSILLINLIKITDLLMRRQWDIQHPKNKQTDFLLSELNFYRLLVKNVPNQNMFWANELNSDLNINVVMDSNIFNKRYPIYELNFIGNSNNKRDVVEKFKQFLINELFFLQEKYDFDLSIFIQILIEMAKNSADHTSSNAYFGLDLEDVNGYLKINFSFGDLGLGINNTIRKFIRHDTNFKEKDRHLALTDSYHWALQVGTTTKPDSDVNKGIGMSSIFNLSKQLGFKLSVYDAESRGLLSSAENVTHVELRKIFYAIGAKVGFYYYGETEIKLT